jgi:hypothetical protein
MQERDSSSNADMQQTETPASSVNKVRRRQVQRPCLAWLPVARITATYSDPGAQTEVWVPVRSIIAAWSAIPSRSILQDWTPVARIIEDAQAAQELDQRELASLLRESKRILSPLDDPFSTDFGLHRWLRGSREEVYSDWLAWIMEGLDNAGDVFRLFDIHLPRAAVRWKNTTAQRETPIPDGRLDIVLRWPDKALLVVEVKVTIEGAAYTAKQSRYKKWMDKQTEPYRESVLLIVDAEPGYSEGDFKRRDWRQVCLSLRGMAARRSMTRTGGRRNTRRENVIHSALMLGFAGAVEQNLLGMPGRPLKLMNEGHLLNVFQVQKYLREFHRSAHR